MKQYEIITKFHDKEFDCEAEFKIEECKNSPFSEQSDKAFEEFEKELGEIESVTVVFKKGGKK